MPTSKQLTASIREDRKAIIKLEREIGERCKAIMRKQAELALKRKD